MPVSAVVFNTCSSVGVGAVPDNANGAGRGPCLHPREDRGSGPGRIGREDAGVMADSDHRTPGITLGRREPAKNVMALRVPKNNRATEACFSGQKKTAVPPAG